MILQFTNKDLHTDFEVVEKKCIGHPDTLADGLAEYLSNKYSKYTLERFGVILHHNFDKVGLLGGASYVKYGEGYLTSPIRVLLNGRASICFADEVIPVEDLLVSWSKEFLKMRLPLIDIDKDLVFHNNLSSQSSPGKTDEKYKMEGTRKYWFQPRGLHDLQELNNLFSNDTSLGVGYAPYSILETFTQTIANRFTSEEFCAMNPWIGSDIKIMGYRCDDIIRLTLCIPQISRYVLSENMYKQNLDTARKEINSIAKELHIDNYTICLNTRDDFDKSELYLTAIGSSLESGDEGLVGRGNRINGLITPMRPMSMEGAAGKNPVYHIGKIYHVLAHLISEEIYKEYNLENEVYIISQSGRDLMDPWVIHINTNGEIDNKDSIRLLISKFIKQIPNITSGIINSKFSIY